MADKSIAVDYFRSFLPAVVSKRLDFSTLRQLQETYITDELKEFFADIVYSCYIKNRKLEARLSLLLAREDYGDEQRALLIGSYIFAGYLRQSQNEEELSVIIPVMLYQGDDEKMPDMFQ